MLKTLVFAVTGAAPGTPADAKLPKWVLAVVRGDHEVNEGKVKKLSGCTVQMAPEKDAKAAGFAIGYVSPRTINAVAETLLLVDHDVAQGGFWATGADKADHHVKHFNWSREVGAALKDATKTVVGDLRNAAVGDPSPRAAGSKLEAAKGIEVGHIFKLGTKYSDAMGLAIMDASQQKRSVIMGCYGIGVSRTMASTVEQNHDENGILWPAAIAPYHVLITMIRPDDGKQQDAAKQLAAELTARGVDVLIDDRDERPGVKFKDADLIGIPLRLTLGEKGLEAGAVEYKLRRDPGKGELVPMGEVVAKAVGALGG